MNITILDTATIITDTTTHYRYDLTKSGIHEGWAIPAIVEHIPPGTTVTVTSDEHTTNTLIDALKEHGITAKPADAHDPYDDYGLEDYHLDYAAPEDPIAELRRAPKTRRGRGKHHLGKARSNTTAIAYAATVILLFAGVGGLTLHNKATAHTTPAKTTTTPPPATTTTTARGAYAILEGPGFHLQAPQGFTLTPGEGGLYTATHPAATLRLLIAVEHPPAEDNPADYLNDIATTIDIDETLAYAADEHALDIPDAIEYVEYPGDGSEVHWATWAEPGTTISFGCHTKTTPTATAREDCKKAAHSLTFG